MSLTILVYINTKTNWENIVWEKIENTVDYRNEGFINRVFSVHN